MKYIALLACGLTLLAAPQKKADSELALQAAIHTETVDGDLKSAIEQYKKVIAQAGANRRVAAMALVRMAECHQKLGGAEAQKIFEQVVREYADQKQAVIEAQARLAAMKQPSAGASGIITRQVWKGPKVDLSGTVSPDGKYLSSKDWDANELLLHDLISGTDRPLTKTEKPVGYPENSAISRDGKQVAYAWFNSDNRYDLRLLDLAGSSKPRVLFSGEEVASLTPFDWSPDGKLIAVQLQRKDRTAQIGLISVPDGALRILKSVNWRGVSNLLFSPDGKYLAYDLPAGESEQRDIFLMATNASREIPLLAHSADETVLAWTPEGKHLLFASDRGGTRSLWGLSINDGKPQNAPLLIKQDIGHAVGKGLTRSGTLYLGVGVGGQEIYIAEVDFKTGKLLAAPTKPIQQFMGTNRYGTFSPDGKYIAYLSHRNRFNTLAIRSLETGVVRELRPDLPYFNQAYWPPDGHSIAVHGTDNKGRSGIFRIEIKTGTVNTLVSSEPGGDATRPMWSPDGKTLYYVRTSNQRKALVARDLASGADREILGGPGLGQQPRLSPDGRWLVMSGGDARRSLMLFAVEGGAPREILGLPSNEHFGQLEWAPDGQSILATKIGPASSAAPPELWRIPVDGGSQVKMDLNGVSTANGFGLHPDGRRIAFSAGLLQYEVWAVENFLPLLQAKK